jgi:Protein of unknown function (DUF3987)
MNKLIPHQEERDLAAFYFYNPSFERLPLEKFADHKARSILETLSKMEGDGIAVHPLAFTTAIYKMERLPCDAGVLNAEVIASEAHSWTPAIAETASQAVNEAAERRELEHGLQVAFARLNANEPIANILNALPHHSPPNTVIEDVDELKTCPIEFLDGLIAGDMAREIARVAAVPESLAVAAVLGVASGAIGAGLRVRTWAGETGANLWFLCIARSGTGKDRAMNIAAEPIFALERERTAAWREDVVPDLEADMRIVKAELGELDKALKKDFEPEVKAQLKDAERRRAGIEDKLESEPCLTVGDTTKEAFSLALSRQPGEAAFAISAEARGILDVIAGRYSTSGDEDLWLAGFSGTPVKVNRIGRKTVTLRRPCISALLMIQPDAFRRAAARPEMAESGFLPRFLPFDAKARPQRVADVIEALDEITAGTWRARIEELVISFRDAGENPIIIEMEPGALSLLKVFANETAVRRDLDLADLDAFAARWAEIACKLALILHAIEHGAEAARRPVSAIAATRAYQIVEWFASECADLLGDVREVKQRERRDRLRDLLENSDNGEITCRNLERRHGFPRVEVERILPKIGGRIEMKAGDRGRPSLVAKIVKGLKP